MRILPILAGLALASSLAACTSRTTYVERPPAVVQQPPATVVQPAPPPPTVTVRPNY